MNESMASGRKNNTSGSRMSSPRADDCSSSIGIAGSPRMALNQVHGTLMQADQYHDAEEVGLQGSKTGKVLLDLNMLPEDEEEDGLPATHPCTTDLQLHTESTGGGNPSHADNARQHQTSDLIFSQGSMQQHTRCPMHTTPVTANNPPCFTTIPITSSILTLPSRTEPTTTGHAFLDHPSHIGHLHANLCIPFLSDPPHLPHATYIITTPSHPPQATYSNTTRATSPRHTP